MSKPNISFDPDFLYCLVKAKEEANRLGINHITDILIFKTLIYTSGSHMSELFKRIDVDWKKVKDALKDEVKEWAEEANETNIVHKATAENTAEADDQEANVENNNNSDEGTWFDVQIQENGKMVITRIRFDEDLTMCLHKCAYFKHNANVIDEIAFVLSMLDQPTIRVERFFKEINLDILVVTRYYEGLIAEVATGMYFNEMGEIEDSETDESAEEYYDEIENPEQDEVDEKSKNDFSIPKKLSSFVRVFEANPSEKSPILGREKETNDLIKTLLKAKKSNVILTGKPGVGKTAVVEHLAWLIANEKCPEELNRKKIITLEVSNLIAGTTLRGMAEERFRLVAEFLSNRDDVILFIDEIHTVIGAGSSGNDGHLDFANSLKPILAREGISVIGATTDEEYRRIFCTDGAFKRRFERIEIKEPKSSEVAGMLEEQIKVLSKHHKVAITKPVVNFIINVSGCFVFETANPDRTLDIIDKSMATAKMLDEKVVTSKIVMSNFDANFKAYEKFSREDKLVTAYHEAGHYIVARYAKNFSKRALAVSILPAYCSDGEYLGLTVFDVEDYSSKLSWDYDAFLDEIACDLAGRVGERTFSGKDTSGASSDLEHATNKARNMLLKYGFVKTFSNRRNMEDDLYEDKKQKLDEEITKIIKQAYSLAQTIIREHEEALRMVAEELVENGILTCEKLDKICKECDGTPAIITETEVCLT